jgi:hypothetical protein
MAAKKKAAKSADVKFKSLKAFARTTGITNIRFMNVGNGPFAIVTAGEDEFTMRVEGTLNVDGGNVSNQDGELLSANDITVLIEGDFAISVDAEGRMNCNASLIETRDNEVEVAEWVF